MAIRKGAVKRSAIPPDILAQLHAGTIEALTLAEVLSVDHSILLRTLINSISALKRMDAASDQGIKARIALGGLLLWEEFGKEAYSRFHKHASDTVRSWAAYALACAENVSLQEKLSIIKPLADDRNPGVREWAWMALRPFIAQDIETSMEFLLPWTEDPSANIRRYASEVTRPRGVWCTHIPELKEEPELALFLLEPLRADPHIYVQKSVGNWLNDAAKSKPVWVQRLCSRWTQESPVPATARICRRALRSCQ